MLQVTMVLARGPDRPDGDVDDRIEMRLCLTPSGRIDLEAWESDPDPWSVRRVVPGTRDRVLELVRDEEHWALRAQGGDDAPLWLMDAEVMRPGEIVTLHRPDRRQTLFRVVSVDQEERRTPQPVG